MSSNLPGCTKESIGYILECGECRREGKKRWYCGETSRSAGIRGAEHTKEIDDGDMGHPIVKHAWEEHGGVKPQVIMRIISKHESPMDRQITEAVRISKLFRGDGKENMNAKAEWGIPRTSTMGFSIHRNQDEHSSGLEESRDPRAKRGGGRWGKEPEWVRHKGNERDRGEEDELKGKRKQWRTGNEGEAKGSKESKRMRMSGPDELGRME